MPPELCLPAVRPRLALPPSDTSPETAAAHGAGLLGTFRLSKAIVGSSYLFQTPLALAIYATRAAVMVLFFWATRKG
jgi:hypothetical protein